MVKRDCGQKAVLAGQEEASQGADRLDFRCECTEFAGLCSIDCDKPMFIRTRAYQPMSIRLTYLAVLFSTECIQHYN